MTGKERVRLAFQHQEPDRVPLFELTIDNPTASYVLGRPALCGFGGQVRGVLLNQALLEGRWEAYHRQRVADEIALWRALGLDACPFANPVARRPLAPEPLGPLRWRFTDPESGQWAVCQYVPESDAYDQVDSTLRRGGLEELERLTVTLEQAEPTLDDWDFEPVDTLLREFGDELFLMGHADVDIGSTWDWAEVFLVGLIEAPDLIHRYLDARLKTTLFLAEALLQRGVDGLHGGYDWAGTRGPVFSPHHFDEFVFPRIRQITDLCHRYGAVYVKHTDGNVNSLLPGMLGAGIDGFHAIEPRAGMDIARLKAEVGDRLTLIGNIDCGELLVHGPVEAVRAQTLAVLRAAAPGGGFMLSTSNSVHPAVRPDLYLAMLETARTHYHYPISR